MNRSVDLVKYRSFKVSLFSKGLSKYPLYPISRKFFLQISCSQSQASDRNLGEKWKKNVYLMDLFKECYLYTVDIQRSSIHIPLSTYISSYEANQPKIKLLSRKNVKTQLIF